MWWLRSGWRGTLVLCLLLSAVHTWPLITAPGTLSRNDNGDTMLNEWILAWVAHQLPRAPSHLFDGNIFYPERDSLAFSEPLIIPALMGAPFRWLGASPVLVFNIVLLLGFALTAWAGYALAFEWTGDRAAGLLAGSMFAFNTHTLSRLPHVQGIHAWGLPLTLLAADRIVVHGRWRDALWLAVWMTAMAYTSGYLVVFGAIMVAVVVVARVADWWTRAVRVISIFGIAAAVATIAILPVYLPYRRVARDLNMFRPLEGVTQFSASAAGYLASGGRLHSAAWSESLFGTEIDSFFPGVVVVVFAILAVYWSFRRRGTSVGATLTRRRIVMVIAIAATGFVLSLGTGTPVYGWLYEAFPPMQGLRAAARFGNLVLLGLAVLAAIGLVAARPYIPPRRVGAVMAALVIAANIESLRAPFEYTRFQGIPAVYSLLRQEPGNVVLVEVPFYRPEAVFENSRYVLNSTAHWRPLMNGYSGYTPESYRRNSEIFWHFPEDHAIQAMRRAGATHVMVHADRWGDGPEGEDLRRKILASPHLEGIAMSPGGVMLYRLR